MYVIVEINGQQFKAEEGKKLFVQHIQNTESGASCIAVRKNNGFSENNKDYRDCFK